MPRRKSQEELAYYMTGRSVDGQELHCCTGSVYRMNKGWQQKTASELVRRMQRVRYQHRNQRKGCCGLAGCEGICKLYVSELLCAEIRSSGPAWKPWYVVKMLSEGNIEEIEEETARCQVQEQIT